VIYALGTGLFGGQNISNKDSREGYTPSNMEIVTLGKNATLASKERKRREETDRAFEQLLQIIGGETEKEAA
jgi:hypothetical protein